MAAEIKVKLGLEVELIKGDKGIFDVKFGSDLVFSKYQYDRFPEHHEVIESLEKLIA